MCMISCHAGTSLLSGDKIWDGPSELFVPENEMTKTRHHGGQAYFMCLRWTQYVCLILRQSDTSGLEWVALKNRALLNFVW